MNRFGRAALKNSVSVVGLGVGLALAATPAYANPAGGQVSSGSATISSPSSAKTVVNQSSQGVVINWKSFDINKNEVTQFVQPNAKSVAVNRIGGQNASQILGTLSANGKVVLINPNGIAFGKGSKVNVGALIATTTDGSDSDLLAGRFTKAGSATSAISNGRINANGAVALVAPNVSNSGVVNAKIGSVSLGGSNKFTVDFAGDGLVAFAAGDASKASVSNTGKITGANVSMTARTAEGLATGVVSTSGIVTATGVNKVGGNITLDAGNGGSISVSDAKLVATGLKGGGNVTIGGWNHAAATIDNKSSIDTSATGKGNAGNVSMIAANTSVKGSIAARGGKKSGDGGHIETSGDQLDFEGIGIDASAKHGASGNWLLDPTDLVINAGSTFYLNAALVNNDVTMTTTSSATSDTSHSANTQSGPGDIDIESTISWSSNHTLTLNAYHSVNIYAPINVLGAGTLTMMTNNAGGSGGEMRISAPVTFSTPGSAHLNINGNAYTLEASVSALVDDMNNNSSGYFALANDMDASGEEFFSNPYGWPSAVGIFYGTLEGLGHAIDNLSLPHSGYAYANGFIGYAYAGSVIENLRLTDEAIGAAGATGGLAGINNGTIFNVVTSGTVDGSPYFTAGGVVGTNGGLISEASSSAVVTGSIAGGLVGYNVGIISNSFATGAVTGTSDNGLVGGLSGTSGGIIDHSYATGAVSAGGYNNSDVGGLVGQTGALDINNQPTSVGISVSYSYATGSVAGGGGYGYAGGLIGYTYSGSVDHAYASGFVSGGQAAGGLVGTLGFGTITDSVWDSSSSGQTQYAQYEVGTNIVSVNASNRYTASAYTPFTFSATPGTANAWVLVDQDGTANNAGSAAGGTRPMLLSEYSLGITSAHSLQLMSLGMSGVYYSYATDIDASATAGGDFWSSAGFIPLGRSGAAFGSYFNGYNGAAISNLMVRSNQDYVGLFGYVTSVISGVTLVNPTVTGTAANAYVGALAGGSFGTLSGDHVTGATVNGSGGALAVGGLAGAASGTISQSSADADVHNTYSYAGGLIGYNYGYISQSFSTGTVALDAGYATGGLVGYNFNGAVADSFSMSNVNAGVGFGGASAGGLIGYVYNGTISNSYATGIVKATSGNTISGAIGKFFQGSVTNVYWDTETSGISSDQGGGSGRTTAQLQGALPTGLSSSTWSTGSGLFPYLTWMSPSGTPQVISGFAKDITGTTPISGETLGFAIDGGTSDVLAAFGTTAANGYIYALLSSGAISASGSDVAVYVNGAHHALTYEKATGSISNLQLVTGYESLFGGSSVNSLSALESGLAHAMGSATVPVTTNTWIDSTASGFVIDTALSAGKPDGNVVLSATGQVSQTAAITAKNLILKGYGGFDLTDSSNAVANLSADVSGLDFADTGKLVVKSNLGVTGINVSGVLTLTSTGAIEFDDYVEAGALTVNAGGKFSEVGAGAINTYWLDGYAAGGVKLLGNNVISRVSFKNTGAGGFSLNDTGDLYVTSGGIDGGTGNVSLNAGNSLYLEDNITAGAIVSLTAAGNITQSGGIISALRLKGSGDTVSLTQANMVAQLDGFTADFFTLINGEALTVTGDVTSSHDVAIDTAGDLLLGARVSGDTVSLTSNTGMVKELSQGAITANLLNVSASTGYVLTSTLNNIAATGGLQTATGKKKIVLQGGA